jgi:predicted Zn-dependent peptidase
MNKITTLKNGLTLIIAPMSGTKTLTVLVMVGTGSKYEPAEIGGISHFVEHMFFQGTKTRPSSLAISSELDGIGAEFNAFTGKEYTGYYVKTQSAKIELAMDVVSDILLNSRLNKNDIAREKGVIIEELNMYEDNPIMRIEDIFEECLYGDSPAGRDTIGTKESINGLTRAHIDNYIKSQYAPFNTIVCLAGNIGAHHDNLINKYFSQAQFALRGKNFQEKPAVAEAQSKPQVKINFKKTDQAHISLGVRAYNYNHQDRLIAKLISIILGGSMSSRLFISLRDKYGLAYYVRAESENYTDSGYLTTRAGVPVDKAAKAIAIILGEYNNMKKNLVKPAELNRVKDLLAGRTALQFESSDNLANWYGRQAVLMNSIARTGQASKKDKITGPEEFVKVINKIIASDIKRVANEIFVNKNLNLAVIGPYQDAKEFEKILKL